MYSDNPFEDGFEIEIQLLRDKNATVATATYEAYGRSESQDYRRLVSSGSSKREPGDRANTRVGDAVAVSRALYDLSEMLLQTASEDAPPVVLEGSGKVHGVAVQ